MPLFARHAEPDADDFQQPHGWLPPRSGGYTPEASAQENPEPPSGGAGVGTLGEEATD
jgi:hypothetical protein